jgi:pimeloyl-ACP methyl ester carboxylesterase
MQAKINMLITILTVLALLTACQTTKVEPIPGDTIGMVLMHGIGGNQKYIGGLAGKLRSADILVIMPFMPWSKNRLFDKGYEESMEEIDTHVAKLKKAGAKRIVIAGHSIGANAALGYAARREGLFGVILLAYGHSPSKRYAREEFGGAVARSQALIDKGKGESFVMVSSRFGNFDGTANDILSWLDPEGPAAKINNVPKVKPNTPVLCIDGFRASFRECRRGYIMQWLPNNPNNLFAFVDADHLGTPRASFEEIIEWLRKL